VIRFLMTFALIFVSLSLVNARALASTHYYAHGATVSCFPAQYQGAPAASCLAGFPVLSFVVANYDTQHQTEWCWAASLQMALTALGHKVSQATIVTQAYGAPVNWPAQVETIDDVVGKLTQDDAGNSISVTVTDLADPDASTQVHNIEEAFQRGHPLLLGLPTHVVVLSGFGFIYTNPGYIYVNGRVEDPWPAGYGGFPGGSRVMGAAEYASVQHVWEVNVY
jgi:hypothetical protein